MRSAGGVIAGGETLVGLDDAGGRGGEDGAEVDAEDDVEEVVL